MKSFTVQAIIALVASASLDCSSEFNDIPGNADETLCFPEAYIT